MSAHLKSCDTSHLVGAVVTIQYLKSCDTSHLVGAVVTIQYLKSCDMSHLVGAEVQELCRVGNPWHFSARPVEEEGCKHLINRAS